VTKRQLEAAVPGKRMFLLDAGFDAESIDRAASETRDANLACFVGRMTSQKGIFDLVKLMDKLKTRRPEFRLVMVGTGPEKELLQKEIEKRQLKNIELAGFASNEQKIALMKRSGFFFFPSYEEGWGIALCEALYCECRCVCYELPHYRSIFDDYPAYAKLGDPDDFLCAFQESGPVPARQKEFVTRYDDREIAKRLTGHLSEVAQTSK
jgi:glycosyltransferase involved in cell wall biosynthesis